MSEILFYRYTETGAAGVDPFTFKDPETAIKLIIFMMTCEQQNLNRLLFLETIGNVEGIKTDHIGGLILNKDTRYLWVALNRDPIIDDGASRLLPYCFTGGVFSGLAKQEQRKIPADMIVHKNLLIPVPLLLESLEKISVLEQMQNN